MHVHLEKGNLSLIGAMMVALSSSFFSPLVASAQVACCQINFNPGTCGPIQSNGKRVCMATGALGSSNCWSGQNNVQNMDSCEGGQITDCPMGAAYNDPCTVKDTHWLFT